MLGILGVIPGIAEALMQSSALQQQNNINWEDLQFQKQNASQQYDLSTADRTDANGNVVHYNAALNKWENILTPTQQQITNALQNEQLLSLTEDAPRARALREAQATRGVEAGKEYEKLFSEWKNKPPPTEGAFTDQATTDALFASQDKARSAGNDLARLAVRSGQDPNALSSIVKSVADKEGGDIGGALLQGRAAGKQASASAEQQYRAALDPVKFFAGVQDDLSGYTPSNSTTGASIDQMQRDMMTSISQALANQSSEVGGAYKSLGAGLGQSVDLSGIINSLSKVDPSNLSGGKGIEASVAAPNSGTGLGVLSNPSDPYGTSGYGLGDRTGSNLKSGYPTGTDLGFLLNNLNLNSNDYSWGT